jgi:hypothetical protein
MKREEISSFEYRDNPLDKGKGIRFFRELFSQGKGRFIVEDEFTGLNMVCSSYAFGWQVFSGWVYERCHSPRWEN